MPRRTDSIAHTIRFPIDLYYFIRTKANEEHRTFNSLVIHILAEGIKSIYAPKEEANDGTAGTPD